MKRRTAYSVGAVAVTVGLFTIFGAGYYASRHRQAVTPEMLNALWLSYKHQWIEMSTGRMASQDAIDSTTSEDQGLTMLRAAWMNDQVTFDSAWHWTQVYLQQKDTHLFASFYGKRPDGSYGIMGDSGQLTSGGADSDIALALLFGYERWGRQIYQESAKQILYDLWDHEVIDIKGRPYMLANGVETDAQRIPAIIQPSSYTPYAYRIFAQIDPQHDWNGLLATSYEMLGKSIDAPLDKKKSARLPPDAVAIDRRSGEIISDLQKGMTTDYDGSAFRIPWRLALDWEWSHDDRAAQALAKMQFLASQWRQQNKIYMAYSHDGTIVKEGERPAMYGAALGYFLVRDPATAVVLRDQKLASLYDSKSASFRQPMSAFDATWAWLGLALSEHDLPNLIPSSAIDQLREQFIRPSSDMP